MTDGQVTKKAARREWKLGVGISFPAHDLDLAPDPVRQRRRPGKDQEHDHDHEQEVV